MLDVFKLSGKDKISKAINSITSLDDALPVIQEIYSFKL